MDVQADEAGLSPDPFATAVFQRPPGREGQGQLFSGDLAYPTYADTDKIPVVHDGGRGRGRGGGRAGSVRWLRVAVALLALVVLAAGAALGLVKAGVLGHGNGSSPGTSATPTVHHPAPVAPTTPLLTQTSTGPQTATYAIDISAYAVTVVTSTGRSWVSIGAPGQRPLFEGILAPGANQRQIMLGPGQVSVGAGGTKVIVTSGRRTATLTPPAAPFTYQFTTKS